MPSTLLDPSAVALSGVLLLPLIIALIEFAKRLAPTTPGTVWLGLSMFLGVVGQCLAHVAERGVPTSLDGWLSMAVMGLMVGLAASKTYDQALASRDTFTLEEAPLLSDAEVDAA